MAKKKFSSIVAQTTYGTAVEVEGAVSLAVAAVVDVATPSAKSFATSDIDLDANTIAETGHGFETGLKGQFTTTDTLPAGLSLATDYWVIRTGEDSYAVASTLNNANAGTAVNITDVGVGTHTFTPTALAGATVQLQKSVDADAEIWFDIGSPSNITVDANFLLLEVNNPTYAFVRPVYTLTAGQIGTITHFYIK